MSFKVSFKYLNKVKVQKKINKLVKYKYEEKVIYLLSPEHGNLGDQAIAIAIKKYLEDHYKNKKVIEFSYPEYMIAKEKILEISNDKDIVFLHGGGNLGNLYINEEKLRRDVIKRFINNKIVIMPQSISFTDNENGKMELEKTKEVYNNHNNLHIVCRENKSFNTAMSIFPNNNLLLSPDSVMYLEDYYIDKNERKGVLMALRSDKEKVMDPTKIDKIEKILRKLEVRIKYKDTIINKNIDKKKRVAEFEKILHSFGSSKLIITDRFHGVIFSVITRTPCIVFKSLDHKIAEGIKWFKHMDFIYYAEEENENLESKIQDFLSLEVNYKDAKLKNEFIKILENVL